MLDAGYFFLIKNLLRGMGTLYHQLFTSEINPNCIEISIDMELPFNRTYQIGPSLQIGTKSLV